jgi:hypothetical protein
MTNHEMTTIVVRKMKDLNLEIARQFGHEFKIPPDIVVRVITGAIFGLGVTMMIECGKTEEELVETVRSLVADLQASPEERGAS